MIEDVWTGLRRVLAPNPSPLTGPGTNTWIIGTDAVAVIDPGPSHPAHLAAIETAIGGARLEAIFVTHAHLDHSALAPALARRTGVPVLAFGDATAGRSVVMAHLAEAGLSGGGEGVDHGFAPDHVLPDGAIWRGAAGEVQALHTPGHMANHLCLLWEGVAFSGDHVMGWSSTIVSPPDGDLTDYMASLDRLRATGATRLLPGHGPVVDDPTARIAALAAHRRSRESEILTTLCRGPQSPAQIVAAVYRDVPPSLHGAAERNVFAHLIDLHKRKLVVAEPEPGIAAVWRLM